MPGFIFEIVAVPRRIEIAADPAQRQLEIVDPAWLAFEEAAEMESAAAMLEAALPLQLFALHDLHGHPPVRAMDCEIIA